MEILTLHHPQIAQYPHAIEALDAFVLGPLQEHVVTHPHQAVHPWGPLRLHQQEPIQSIDVFGQYPERIGLILGLIYHQAEYCRSICRVFAVIFRLTLRGSSNEPRRVN